MTNSYHQAFENMKNLMKTLLLDTSYLNSFKTQIQFSEKIKTLNSSINKTAMMTSVNINYEQLKSQNRKLR